MAEITDGELTPAIRFKRRKIAHPRRPAFTDENAPGADVPQPTASHDTLPSAIISRTDTKESDHAVPNLKEILRNRRRPQHRSRAEPPRKPDPQSDALIPHEPSKQDIYSGKFVAQTGQIVDQDDKQMMNYVEARIAEQNHRQYGWPIPKHLENYVNQDAVSTRTREERADTAAKAPESTRMAVGMGKLQEIDLGPEATARNIERTEQARRRLEGHAESAEDKAPEKVRLGKDGKPRRRWQKRRNSEDIRRDQMVEAVLREAKLDYFDEEPTQTANPTNPNQDADDALAEQFRREFLDSLDSRNQRKPAPPPGPKGAKEQPKGPKLGGSRSARAAMRLQEEQAAKGKR